MINSSNDGIKGIPGNWPFDHEGVERIACSLTKGGDIWALNG